MKKKIVKRIWIGFPVGIAIGYIITLVISACIGDGTVYSATPEFVQRMGTELSAVILQTALCGVLGSGFAAASVIWEIDSWSLAKQSGVYFIVIGAILLPIAYVTNWMRHSVAGSCLMSEFLSVSSWPFGFLSIYAGRQESKK